MTANPPESDALLEQAIDWMIRTESEPDNPQLRQALQNWRSADQANEAAWLRARRVWESMGEWQPDRKRWPDPVSDGNGEVSGRLPRIHSPRRSRGLRRVATLAAVACLMLAAWPGIYLHLRADHITGTGETQQITLEDGSTVYLGAASAIRTRFSSGERHVDLLSGQAFFDVMANAERPFIVNAGDVNVTVLGTAFDVQLGSRVAAVSVQSGSVAVQPREGDEQQLSPGQQLMIERSSGASRVAQISPSNVAAWREGRLFVHDRTLYDVVETLDRYYGGRILVGAASLGEQRVTGSYNLDNPDIALKGLLRPFDGRVLEITPLLRVLRDS
ncbi:FecR family protein [Marinimicrobium sp. ARAG 43.8]|uniref:FecR family protein n=1 Tax=Marinimicrobium sp. ARAG 43.8 TaxID=3418719 RepID=UPI003CFA753C